MAQDIRDLLDKAYNLSQEKMPENHQERFLEKLDHALPVQNKLRFNKLRVAASMILLLGLGYGAYTYYRQARVNPTSTQMASTKRMATKTLGDVSPTLKKVEDYYLASINLELSKMKYSPENKDLFDGYMQQLDELNKEYQRLSVELTNNGPTELTVNALIDNLKFRLNLLYRLREQLKEFSASNDQNDEAKQSV